MVYKAGRVLLDKYEFQIDDFDSVTLEKKREKKKNKATKSNSFGGDKRQKNKGKNKDQKLELYNN